MNFKKYGIVYLLVVLVLMLFILSRLFPKVTVRSLLNERLAASPKPSTVETSLVTVTIDFGTEQKTYSNIQASNAYLALVEAAKQDKLEVEIKQYDFGIMVQKIGDFTNTATQAWGFYINEQAGQEAADKTKVTPGDKILWKYAKLQ